VLSAVRTTRAALSHLLASRGHIVNIASLAGHAPARYMGAYGPSKAALVSYTRQLRLELAAKGLHVLLVSPGPIARATPRTYSAAEEASIPAEFLRPGGGVKTTAVSADWLVKRTLQACERREAEVTVPRSAKILFAIMQLAPRWADAIVRKSS
ncbi:MAG TPA: SDR family NAD(P)-dependent oxidoreductase, partial [Pirellulales bacterium]|nr:SDR family NAD(P)-dependent oxidoreductase [Pirellulales bacterium]